MSWPRCDRIGSRGLGRICSKSGARHCIIVRRRVAFVDKLRRYRASALKEAGRPARYCGLS
jgi:hypothetical protein